MKKVLLLVLLFTFTLNAQTLHSETLSAKLKLYQDKESIGKTMVLAGIPLAIAGGLLYYNGESQMNTHKTNSTVALNIEAGGILMATGVIVFGLGIFNWIYGHSRAARCRRLLEKKNSGTVRLSVSSRGVGLNFQF